MGLFDKVVGHAEVGGDGEDAEGLFSLDVRADGSHALITGTTGSDDRSEERRVGKECRSRWSPYH